MIYEFQNLHLIEWERNVIAVESDAVMKKDLVNRSKQKSRNINIHGFFPQKYSILLLFASTHI